jgi:hypothetical protein
MSKSFIQCDGVTYHNVISRTSVIKHNQVLKASSLANKISAAESGSNKSVGSKRKSAGNTQASSGSEAAQQSFPDQGFVSPRVLVLCPFRSSARKLVFAMKEILGKNTTVSKALKFDEEFGFEEEEDSDNDDDEDDEDNSEDESDDDVVGEANGAADWSGKKAKSSAKDKHKKPKKSKMPADWDALFNDNVDDDFKFGIQVNPQQGKGAGKDKGVYLKLYSDFYESDIIIASPLGLKLAVDNRSASGTAGEDKLTFDFLSSVELVVLHQSDVMYMQNWDHVEYILSQINRMPKVDRGTDFSRVRPYFLEGDAAAHRQLVVSSEYNAPGSYLFLRDVCYCLIGFCVFSNSSGFPNIRSESGRAS